MRIWIKARARKEVTCTYTPSNCRTSCNVEKLIEPAKMCAPRGGHLFDFNTGAWSGSSLYSTSECTAAGGVNEVHGTHPHRHHMCCFFEGGDDIGVQKAKAPNDSGV